MIGWKLRVLEAINNYERKSLYFYGIYIAHFETNPTKTSTEKQYFDHVGVRGRCEFQTTAEFRFQDRQTFLILYDFGLYIIKPIFYNVL